MKRYFFLLLLGVWGCASDSSRLPQVTIFNEQVATLDDRLFGQFLEKPSWHGEWGPEAALRPGTHELQAGVEQLMEGMRIPVLRFPGGTDVNFQDWTETIDNVPGRPGGRPLYVGIQGDTVSQEFGYDEALQLAERLGAEMIIVPNFGDAYFKRKPLEESVMHELGLIAYCNSEVGAELPEGMPDWPAVRARNGHPEPYRVRYVQLANEPWVMDRELKRSGEIDQAVKDNYFACLQAFIDGIEKIDPTIEIIVDANSEAISSPLPEMFGDRIDYIAVHTYMPWGINEVLKGEEKVEIDSLTEEEKWLAWVTVPRFDDQGFSVMSGPTMSSARDLPYPIAITEWNWNGWWGRNSVDPEKLGSEYTKGVGAAGYLHAFIREGSQVEMGIQSMLVGNSWGITGIRVSPEQAFAPYPLPTGMVTGLYSNYHGEQILQVETEGIPTFRQEYKMSGILPAERVAYIDPVVTADAEHIYLHVINRHFSEDIRLRIETRGWSVSGEEAILRSMVSNDGCSDRPRQSACIEEKQLSIHPDNLEVVFPSQSVSVLQLNK